MIDDHNTVTPEICSNFEDFKSEKSVKLFDMENVSDIFVFTPRDN